MKKIASLFLALTLCVALAVPAFAEVPTEFDAVKLDIEKGMYSVPGDRVELWAFDENKGDEVFEKQGDATVAYLKPGAHFYAKNLNPNYKFRIYYEVYRKNIDGRYVFTYYSGVVPEGYRNFLRNDGTWNGLSTEVCGTYWGEDDGLLVLPNETEIAFTLPETGSDDVYYRVFAEVETEEELYWRYFTVRIDSSKVTSEPAAKKPEVVPTNQKLMVNGAEKNTEIYNIDGSNYFKLRDMAMLMNGTGSQFSVDFDSARNTVVVKTNEAYTPLGSELKTGKDNSSSAVVSPQSVEIDGTKVDLTAYNIGGANFFKLRDLGGALGFDVDYDTATATMIVKSK